MVVIPKVYKIELFTVVGCYKLQPILNLQFNFPEP